MTFECPSYRAEPEDPHQVENMTCERCGFQWVAVFAVDVERVECVQCGYMNQVIPAEIVRMKEDQEGQSGEEIKA